MILRLVSQIIITAITSGIFYGIDLQYNDARIKAGGIFIVSLFEMMITYYSGLFCIICERDILRKEYQNKTYGLAAVYTLKVAFELPIVIMLGFIL